MRMTASVSSYPVISSQKTPNLLFPTNALGLHMVILGHAPEFLEIVLESAAHVGDLLQMHARDQHLAVLGVLVVMLSIPLGQGNHGVEGVPDLAAIPVEFLDLFVVVRVVHDGEVDLDRGPLLGEFAERRVPDLAPVFDRQVRQVQHRVDARQDRLVEAADPVRRQEHQPRVVFDCPQEHRHDAVAVDVAVRARFKEYVRFVEQEHAVPQRA